MDWDTDDVRDDSIEAVIECYWKYKNVIQKNMPIKTLGVTFFPDWTDRVEVIIERWKNLSYRFSWLARISTIHLET